MITKNELVLAWRKAKIDLYYSTNPPLLQMADYEENLIENLENLADRVNGKNKKWITEPEFLGTWTLAPKAISFKKNDTSDADKAANLEENDTILIFADPKDEWQSQLDRGNAPVAEYRLMARCSISFHVLSTLWMLQVGELFDKQLSQNVHGSRLRRNRYDEINPLSLGSFKPYLKPFRDWRDGAVKTMSNALSDKKEVIALTADVSSFYHELNADFMLSEEFNKLVGITLSEDQAHLHSLFITALCAWAKNTPLKKGLPVGLPASAVVANAALFQLDQFIEQQVVPLYYGRYVDDILLVMENTSGITSSNVFWEWVINRDGGKNLLKQDSGSISFSPKYLKDCRIAFENSKNKLFVLSGNSGIALINAIKEQINQRASEWRALPSLPDNPSTIATDLLKATNNSGEHADNLRKTDSLSLYRAGFALSLRDFEAYERDLPPDAWQAHRHAFFDAVSDHLLTPVKFFELAQYLPRIVRMATACEDFEKLGAMLHRLRKLTDSLSSDCCELNIKACEWTSEEVRREFYRWNQSLSLSITESVLSALPPKLTAQSKLQWKRFISSHWRRHLDIIMFAEELCIYPSEELAELQQLQALLFSHDLAHIPLRFSGMPRETVSQRGIPSRAKLTKASWKITDILGDVNWASIRILADWFKPKLTKGIPPGLYFSTRPFSLNELYLITPNPFSTASIEALKEIVIVLRGFELEEDKMPRWDKRHQRYLEIPDSVLETKQTIAVSSWEVADENFVAAALGQSTANIRQRYQRLNRLINELISRPDGAGYFILPELAIPSKWFMRIAGKLNGRRISLITGVEYLHASKKHVHNQIWVSLTHDGLGFPSLMLYRQDKQKPAIHEEAELFKLGGLKLQPSANGRWNKDKPPIIKHGDFHLALLNCSELTNIRYRAALRGKIDALFITEWNSDVDTFNALVESAALDIHAYIIQCNNRQYGDSRIRAPYKARWKRDLLRVKGGNHDYCITGKIDVLALRKFQSNHRSPETPFKPVPDGFNQDMARTRKVLPKGMQV